MGWSGGPVGGGGSSALLAAAQVSRATSGSTSYGAATWVAIVENSVTLEVAFTTGTTGKVLIVMSFAGSSANAPRFRLYDTGAAAVVSGSYQRGVYGTSPGNFNAARWLLTLSPLTAYTLRPQTAGIGAAYNLSSGPGAADGDNGPIICTVQEV